MDNIKNAIFDYFLSYPLAKEIFDKLLEIGDVFCIGGLLREYRDSKRILHLRDADFSVNIHNSGLWTDFLSKKSYKNNRFGGWKFDCGGFFVDVWDIKNTWAIKNGLVEVGKTGYLVALSQSVYLNIDGIVYDISNQRWADEPYYTAMNTKELDIVLEKNPFVDLNILRAMILRRQYNLLYSDRIKSVINEQNQRMDNYSELLLDIQKERYLSKVISKEEIEEELKL